MSVLLNNTALAFAQECLGWKEVSICRNSKLIATDGSSPVLKYSDIGEVMIAVARWWKFTQGSLFIQIDDGGMRVIIEWRGHRESRTVFNEDDFTQQLMQCCLHVQRRMLAEPQLAKMEVV